MNPMKSIKQFIFVALLLSLLINGCFGGDEEPTATPVPPTATSAPLATPIPTDTVAPVATKQEVTAAAQTESPMALPESPLAIPESPLAIPELQAAAPTDTTGSVTGVLLIESDTVQKPVADTKIALAEVIKDENGVPRATGYDPTTPFQTTSDATGRFVINGIKPGLYGVIVDGVLTSVMLSDPKSGESIIIDIKVNDTVDIGTLKFKSLALPGFDK